MVIAETIAAKLICSDQSIIAAPRSGDSSYGAEQHVAVDSLEPSPDILSILLRWFHKTIILQSS